MSDNYFLNPDNDRGDYGKKSPLRALPGQQAEQGSNREEFFRRSPMGGLVSLALIAGGMTGLIFAFQLSLSVYADDVDALADYKPNEVTKVYADDGTQIGELSLERRIPLEYNEIPERMKQAILAIEDTRFYEHH